MSKITVIFFSAFFTCLAIMACLGGTLYISWHTAQQIEKDKLFDIAKTAVNKIYIGLDQIYKVFSLLKKEETSPCSPEHIKKMQNLLFNNPYILDIEYIENNHLRCSALAIRDKDSKISTGGYEMSNDVTVTKDVTLSKIHDNNILSLQENNYSILVNAQLLTNIFVDSYIKIAIFLNDGTLLNAINAPNENLLTDAKKSPKLIEIKEHLAALYRIPDIYVIAFESENYLFKMWRKQLMLFMPFGLMLCAIATGLIYCFSKRRLSPAGELKIAIKQHEFVVYYQPIIDFITGQCHGAEALIRWQRPDGSVVRPDLFIPLAEESGLIGPITDQVIDRVIKDMQEYFIANRGLHVAINIAAEDFNSGRILEKMEKSLANTGIQPAQIWLEITERGFMNINSCKEKIIHANQLGYIIVIDDFGTGYSSLSYLKEVPVHVLKIDKSFINTVTTDSATSSVTYYIIKIAKSLNLKIVAEGVETQAQADYLKKNQVEYAQGWLYAKAMSGDEFKIFYQQSVQAKPQRDQSND